MLGARADVLASGKRGIHFYRTGLPNFDRQFGGLSGGIVTFLGARPSVGKSMVGSQLADGVAENGARVLIISLEDPPERYAERVLSRTLGAIGVGDRVDKHERFAFYTPPAWADRVEYRHDLRSVDAIGARLRQGGVDFMMLDYCQVVKYRHPDPQAKAEALMDMLKEAIDASAGRLGVLLLGQLNRGFANRAADRDANKAPPTIADIKDSGIYEERSKAVILLHRSSANAKLINFDVQKINFGEPGSTSYEFDGARATIRERPTSAVVHTSKAATITMSDWEDA